MNEVKWTKRYDLKVDNRSFKVFISADQSAGFYAACLWYEGGRLLHAPGQPGALTFQLEQRYATTEADAIEQLTAWVEAKFGKGYTLKAEV